MTPSPPATRTETEIAERLCETWTRGIASFQETQLRELLSEEVVFEGPLAGRTVGPNAYVEGLKRFAQGVVGFRLLQRDAGPGEVAMLYECDLIRPKGTYRFAEFLRISNGKIVQDRLVFDTVEFRKPATSGPGA